MRFIAIGILLIVSIGACKKKTEEIKSGETLFVKFKLDGVPYSTYLPVNDLIGSASSIYHQEYGSPGFCIGPYFSLAPNTKFAFVLGYGLRNAPVHDTYLALTNIGSKDFDFLEGNYHPVTNKVEIHFLEPGDVFWSSTKQTYDYTGFLSREVKQPASSYFEILSRREISLTGNTSPTIFVTAKFDCVLYEGNGSRTKRLTDGEVTCNF